MLRILFLGKTRLVVMWLVWKQPFLPFLTQPWHTVWPQMAQIWDSLKSILVNRNYIIINFMTLRLTKKIFFFFPYFFPLKGIPHVKYEKNLLIMPVSLLFSQHWGPNLAQILPQDHIHFDLFCWFSNVMKYAKRFNWY